MTNVLEHQLNEATSPLVDDRWFLALATDILPQAVSVLVQDPDETVRVALASNPSLPVEVQRELASTSDPETRRALAVNTGLDLAVQALLARDEDPLVRAALAGNPALGFETRELLASDGFHVTQRALRLNGSIPAQRSC